MKNKLTQNICYIALFVAIITVCSWISVPIGMQKYTLQLVGVLLAGGLLGWKRGAIAVLVYLLLGFLGIPVFAGFGTGFSFTTGYCMGFFFTAICAGLGHGFDQQKPFLRYGKRAALYLFGVLLCYAFGTGYVMVLFDYPLVNALLVCVLPYVWFDIVKIILSLVLVDRLQRFVK